MRLTSVIDEVHDYLTSRSVAYQYNILSFRESARQLSNIDLHGESSSLDVIVP